jgi:hypothetical protein
MSAEQQGKPPWLCHWVAHAGLGIAVGVLRASDVRQQVVGASVLIRRVPVSQAGDFLPSYVLEVDQEQGTRLVGRVRDAPYVHAKFVVMHGTCVGWLPHNVGSKIPLYYEMRTGASSGTLML